MQTLGSPASVIAAIHEEAEAQVERLESTTAAQLAAIREETETVDVTIADRAQRLAAARREAAERLAKQEWEGRRAVIEQREAWIQRVVAKAREAWPARAAASLDALTREARAQLPDGPCEVTPCERGGCVVSAGDVRFDNTFEARELRRESEWRTALSRMYAP